MSVDERGQRAADALERQVRGQIDAAESLRQLHDTTKAKVPTRRRRAPMALAFVAVVVIVAIVAVALSVRSHDTEVLSGGRTYAYLPSDVPSDMHPSARLGSTRRPPTDALRGIRYVATDRQASISVVTSTGPAMQSFGDTPPQTGTLSVRGHSAQLYQPPSGGDNLDLIPVGVSWEEGGFRIDVWAVGLTVDDLLQVARSVRSQDRAQFRQVAGDLEVVDPRLTPGPDWSSALEHKVELASFEQVDGPGSLAIGTAEIEGLDWRCVVLTDQEASTGGVTVGKKCVSPDRDLDLPTFLDDYPRVSFVIGAFEKSVESVVVTRDTGETFTATLHDTHAGRRPVVAVVNLGAGLRSQTPNASAVVTDTTGRVVQRVRIAT